MSATEVDGWDGEWVAKLEAELEQGWPQPWWLQDRPRFRRQWLPERCCHGHLLDESTVVWKRSSFGGLMRWVCRRCRNARNRGVPTERLEQAA